MWMFWKMPGGETGRGGTCTSARPTYIGAMQDAAPLDHPHNLPKSLNAPAKRAARKPGKLGKRK